MRPSGDIGGGVVDLTILAGAGVGPGPVWAYGGEDLNANLVVFAAGDGVAGHVNDDVDVLLVGIAGEGVVEVDGASCALRAGQALVIPKGAHRSIRSNGGRFALLTCHRRRDPLRPARLLRSGARAGDSGRERAV